MMNVCMIMTAQYKKIKLYITSVLLQKFLHVSIEENPFEKGFFLKLLS